MPDLSEQRFKPLILSPPPPLPTHPPTVSSFAPMPRLTREHLDIILATVPPDFLQPAEIDLLVYVLSERQRAIAFTDNERGIFNREYFPDYVIPVIEHVPWVRSPIPIPKAIEKDVLRLIREQTLAGKYEDSVASYRSRVFTVLKKNGVLRLVHDLQDLNAVTIRDSALPPRPDDFAESFVGRAIYGVADLFSGYDAQTLDVRSRDLTTFQCLDESARNTCLPQGATNAVCDFGRCTKHMLRDEPDAKAFVDDAGIMGPPTRYNDIAIPDNPGIRRFVYEYATSFDRVFRRFELAGVTVSGTKLVLAAPQVQIVGSVVSLEGWHLCHGVVNKVLKWPYPTNLTEVRSFLGIAGVGRRWIKGFSLIAKPLTVLCRHTDDLFVLTDDGRAAMDKLKALIASAPVLKAVDYDAARSILPPIQTPLDGLVVVGVDSSIYGAGWVLYQFHGKDKHPALFGSCTFLATESRYSQPKVELYGVFRALKELRSRIWGTHFLIEVDAKFLQQMIREPDLPNAPMTCWVSYIQLFDFTLQHVPAEKGKAQDALSRRPSAPEDSEESNGEAHLDEVLGYKGTYFPPSPLLPLSRSILAARLHDAMAPAKSILGRDVSKNDTALDVGLHALTHMGSFTFVNPEYFDRYPPPASMLRSNKTTPMFLQPCAGRTSRMVEAEFLLGDETVTLEYKVYDYKPEDDGSGKLVLDFRRLFGDADPLPEYPEFYAAPLGYEVGVPGDEVTDDEGWADLISFLQTGELPLRLRTDTSGGRRLRNKATRYTLINNRLWQDRKNRNPVLVVTDIARRKELIAAAHLATGHRGRDATYKTLSDRYYWPTMFIDVGWFVRSCNTCQYHSRIRTLTPLSPSQSPTNARRFVMDTIYMPNGEFLLHASDADMKWIEARWSKKNDSRAWERFVYEDIICRFGCCCIVVCDGGPEFKGAFASILAKYGIPIIMSTPYHPEGNGIAERDGQTLARICLRMAGDKPHEWSKYLHSALLAMRTTVSRTTGYTPYYLLYGMHCLYPFDLTDRTWYTLDWHKVRSTEDLLTLRATQLARRELDIGEAQENVRKTRQRAVDDFEKRNAHRIRREPYEIGTWVLLHETWLDNQHGNKGAMRWAGPYVVHKRHKNTYMLKELDGALFRSQVAGSRLRLFYFRDELQTLRTSSAYTIAECIAPSQRYQPQYEFACNLVHYPEQQYYNGLAEDARHTPPTYEDLVAENGDFDLGTLEYDEMDQNRFSSARVVNTKTRTNIRDLFKAA
ncbi:Retrovirus-related Pol polyprotein from transposon 17.6 [Trametes pubescens]|uniref:Retrovirus-related Pol polyprotein from transposon 17.6 n=1 Tax=Trametes pubescens TaxID=154538 RepID=A0A1M2VQW4_TRAPU|nr:Retrovirus-related Pol polyprotein from transposon 17.6 [Trametes pubescens]